MDWEREAYARPPGGGFASGIATLLIGAAIGAAAALLLAPKAGQDLRTRVAGAAGGWKEHAAEALAQGRESVVSAVEQAQGTTPPPDTRPERPDLGAVKPV